MSTRTRAPVIFTKMVTRKKPEQKEPLPEEIPSVTAKRAKKVATPSKSSTSPPKRPRTPAIPKSPSPRKKGNAVRAKPIQLDRPEIGPPEETITPVNDLPSLTALENAHLAPCNQPAGPRQNATIAGRRRKQPAEGGGAARPCRRGHQAFCPHR